MNFFLKVQEAWELIKNHELKLYVSCNRLSKLYQNCHILVSIQKLNKNVVLWQSRNNRKLQKHKLSQNAKNLQFLLKFRLIEDNVTVFQWPWNSESRLLVNRLWPWKNLKEKKLRFLKKMLFFVRRTLKRWQTSTNN